MFIEGIRMTKVFINIKSSFPTNNTQTPFKLRFSVIFA